MKFNETLMYKILQMPIEAWEKLNIYSFVLCVPALLVMLVIGIVVSLIFDLVVSVCEL